MSSNPSKDVGNDLPVNRVTWSAAKEFCEKLSEREAATYKLPTIAQWIYAARSGGMQPRLYGSYDEVGWHADNAGESVHPVGQKRPNAWGMYDVLGNVSEWTEDIMGNISGSSLTNPFGKALPVHSGVSSCMGAGISYIRSSFKDMYVSVTPKDAPSSGHGFRVIRLTK